MQRCGFGKYRLHVDLQAQRPCDVDLCSGPAIVKGVSSELVSLFVK
jgi:hypothetical protein